MNFSPAGYSRLHQRLTRKYKSDITKTRSGIKRVRGSVLASWVLDHRDLLSDYSALNWYFLQQLQTYLFFATAPLPVHDGEGLSKMEEKVFDRWNSSEMADVFLKALNAGKTVPEASSTTLKKFEQHLLTLAKRHLLKQEASSVSYRSQIALGEKKEGTRLKRLLETTINIEGKPLAIRTGSAGEMRKFSARIENALAQIRKFSPGSWDRFSVFTEVIVPIKVKEFVSYSHQELPGVSMINMVDRDFVDLMDDLLHENGHHHLNHYLNLGPVIKEPQENIYYSPWRRTLRPFRGIYHAYFTFFWAFQLFSDLAQSADLRESEVFSEKEIEKIHWRAVEEYWMLEYTFLDLTLAKKKGLVSALGWNLVNEQRKALKKYSRLVPTWERRLKSHRKDLQGLKAELKKATKTFKRS